MRHVLIWAAATVLAAPANARPAGAPATTGPAAGAAIELSTGLDYEEGEFGTGESVETLTLPAGLLVSTGRFRFSARLPYLRVDAPGNVIGGGLLGLPIIDPTRPATRQTRQGIGDLRLGAAYVLPVASANLSLSGEVKVPTASLAKGLGTGEADYSASAELSRSLGRVTPFAGVAYNMPGDPDGFELRDSLSAWAGAAVQIGGKLRGHASYGYAQSLSPLVEDDQRLTTGLSASLSPRLALGLYGSAGLSDGAPDVGAGIRLGFRIR
jgi:hypothetical protein